MSRPNKPDNLDEQSWEDTVRDEIAGLLPRFVLDHSPVPLASTRIDALDLDLLANAAVVDADERSTRSGGRFSSFDLRAGATRALAGSGVVARRDDLTETIDAITDNAHRKCVRLLKDAEIAGHVKAFMATETVRLKMRLAGHLDALASPGRSLLPHELRQCAASPEDVERLDTSQLAAAGAIAGTARLVAIIGPAGAGKTTMLRIAYEGLEAQQRRMLVVAPTRKAASVASREVGAEASSLHALLADHGYRWTTDAVGAQVWTRLSVGETDPNSGTVYRGPSRFVLRRGDRIVVDEAGMVDLQTADALVDLAIRQQVGVAMVGDPYQALPVDTRERWHPQCALRQHPSNSTPCIGSATPSTPCLRFAYAIHATGRTRSPLQESCSSAGTCIGRGARRKRAKRWSRRTSIGTRAGSGSR